MRSSLFITTVGAMLIGQALSGQAIMDATAALAGGVAGGASGKKVSDGMSSILGKVAKQTAQAAGETKAKSVVAAQAPPPNALPAAGAPPSGAPLLEVGPGVPKSGGVPLPPPAPHKTAIERAAPITAPEPVVAPEPPVAPPPPEATSDDLRKVASGTSREDLLKLGAPASRIMMFDDGHLQETFRYANGDASIGVVHLMDGAVTKVEVK